MTLQKISQILLTTLGVLIPLTIAVQMIRRRIQRRKASSAVDDPQALEMAQAQVNRIDLRRELTATHTLLDHYSSMQGYTMNYMDQLVEHLARQGVESAQYTFQESVPVGVISVVGFTGTFELYVPRGAEDQARAAIKNFKGQA